MIDYKKLDEIIAVYKERFVEIFKGGEGYKWRAVQHFQKHWNVDAKDFGAMFKEATRRTDNLLASRNNFPKAMIEEFCNVDQEAVRQMFKVLYDEDRGLAERIQYFMDESERLRLTYGAEKWSNHFQNTNAISTYLWLRFPDKYYIYKYSEIKKFAHEVGSSYTPRAGSIESVKGAFGLYDELSKHLRVDNELRGLLKTSLVKDYYDDPNLNTMAIDVIHFVSTYMNNQKGWWPSKEEYDPSLSVDDWVKLLNNPEVFNESSSALVKRWKDCGGEATCAQIAEKYGNTAAHYISTAINTVRKIIDKTGVAEFATNDDNSKYWPVMFLGRDASSEEKGVYKWKLREELFEALDKVDLSHIPLYTKNNNEGGEKQYWWLVANPNRWSAAELSVGGRQEYTVKSERGNWRQVPRNFKDAKEGDVVFMYESSPTKQLVSLGTVSKASDDEVIEFEKTEQLSNPIKLVDIRDNPELAEMEFVSGNGQGSLFKVTSQEADVIYDLIRESNPAVESQPKDTYTKKDFLSDVFMTSEDYDDLKDLLEYKKNIILQGAPGVGKTYAAKRLAYSIMGEKDDSRIGFVQFHQNYSYEDFVMGYKPTEDGGFELKNGVFHKFCTKAANQPDKKFFFIIDEINRGNLSKIFGELLMAIEESYRGDKVVLAYSESQFAVPKNIYIIGMMNTADRSLALMDYALRRRFSFKDMRPAFEIGSFVKYRKGLNSELFDWVINKIIELNEEISNDDSLGDGFCIGHSHFCNLSRVDSEKLQQIIKYDILPTLQEYWFDDKEKYEKWVNSLSRVFND